MQLCKERDPVKLLDTLKNDHYLAIDTNPFIKVRKIINI